VLTDTLHYGMGVFEGIRAYETARGTAMFRLAEHIGRLFRSARILGIPMPYDHAALTEVCRRMVRDNDLKSAYIRPLALLRCRGDGAARRQPEVRVGRNRLFGSNAMGDAPRTC
jgi:branched-chain amino acid aminotransferase